MFRVLEDTSSNTLATELEVITDLYLGVQGVEPRTYALEGRCSIQLSYTPRYKSPLQSIDVSNLQWIEELFG